MTAESPEQYDSLPKTFRGARLSLRRQRRLGSRPPIFPDVFARSLELRSRNGIRGHEWLKPRSCWPCWTFQSLLFQPRLATTI